MTEFIITCQSELQTDGSYKIERYMELVRCKDCKYAEVPILNYFKNTHRYCTKYELTEPKDWFCADGERKEVR